MLKRLLLVGILVGGCTSQPLPSQGNPPASAGANPTGTARPFIGATYSTTDFEIGVPDGWVQTARDQAYDSVTTKRVIYANSANPSDADASLIVISSTLASPNATRQQLLDYIKKLALALPRTEVVKDLTLANGEAWGFVVRNVVAGAPTTNYYFADLSKTVAYQGIVSYKTDRLTEDQAMQIATSFKRK